VFLNLGREVTKGEDENHPGLQCVMRRKVLLRDGNGVAEIIMILDIEDVHRIELFL